ncbi:hypothetical protein [Streptomyces sp. A012304]|uniref:hypothetical protein n=1 Tax=Streptomyces sp. A012304 TaxID=375446 RepID=UPI0022318893|nr:hypothetical protein [Streptomyces sp. A012304]GKQ37193.1 hypothetical protein ALMP_37320 [Streptomyces sp. A012304]
MATPTDAPTQQITLSDLYADRGLSEAQARRIVALLGLAQPRRGPLDAEGPQPTTDRLGA